MAAAALTVIAVALASSPPALAQAPSTPMPKIRGCSSGQTAFLKRTWRQAHVATWQAARVIRAIRSQPNGREELWNEGYTPFQDVPSPLRWFGRYSAQRLVIVDRALHKAERRFANRAKGGLKGIRVLRCGSPLAGVHDEHTDTCVRSEKYPEGPSAYHSPPGEIVTCPEFWNDATAIFTPQSRRHLDAAAVLAHEIMHWLTVNNRYVTDLHPDGAGGRPDDLKYYGRENVKYLAERRPSAAVYNNDTYEYFIRTVHSRLPIIERVEVHTASTDSRTKNAIVTCPSGMRAVSAGGHAVGAAGAQLLDDAVILSERKVSITAIQHSPSLLTAAQRPWSLSAYAICASDLARLKLSTVSADASPAAPHAATARCPAGTRVIGTGGDLQGSDGQAFISSIVPTATSVRVTGSDRGLQSGPLRSWRVRAFATCAKPLPGLRVVAGSSSEGPDVSHLANPACPADHRLTGMGAEVRSHQGLAVLTTIRPRAKLDGAELRGHRTTPDVVPNYSVRGYAICAAI